MERVIEWAFEIGLALMVLAIMARIAWDIFTD
jgi:hypothetical protein